jgi:hypothetical protein
MASIDSRSDRIVLVHDGSGRGAGGAPARDLSEHDVARLAYQRSLAEVIDRVGQPVDPEDPEKGVISRPDPRTPDPDHVEAILAELEASGRYAAPKPEKKAKASKADKAAEPDKPAEPPNPDAAATAEKPEA